MRLRSAVGMLLAIVLGLAAGATAQTTTTGRIIGTISDQQGAVVPGATVVVTSPQLQGERMSVTDGTGEFRFLSLPPGVYMVKAELSGFETLERDNIRVDINSTVTLPLTLSVAGVAAAVTVSAAIPVVDTTSTQGGVVANIDVLQNLPLGRDFYSIARLAPGVASNAIGSALRNEFDAPLGAAVYGASAAENQYIIDGVNVTGINRGEANKAVNMDFVQEVQVMTTGLNAEYGRMTGGIINVVTQSGGNTFHGSAFGFYSGGGLVSDNSTGPRQPLRQQSISKTALTADGGGSLGGYVVKDRVWFFGAYDYTRQRDERNVIRVFDVPGAPALGSIVPSTANTNLYSAKVTLKAPGNHTIWASTNGEPSKRDGFVFRVQGAETSYSGTLDRGAPNFTVHYDGVLGSTLLIRGIVGQDREKQTYGGIGTTLPSIIDQTVLPNITTGGFGFYQNEDFKRAVYKGDITKFWGPHEIKAGADYEDIFSPVEKFDGGAGQRLYIRRAAGQIYYRHRYFVDDTAPGFSRTNPSTWKLATPLKAEPGDHNTSFYAQDSFKVMSNLSVNYGIRWERQVGLDRSGRVAYDMKKNWAPRFGFVWDPTKAARAKVFGSWGRYFDSIPLDMNIRQFSGEIECFCYNFSASPTDLFPDPAAPTASTLRGSAVAVTDPEIRGQYSDEWTGGVEYEIRPHTTTSLKVVHRSLGRVIEDFLDPVSGVYSIGNPSEGTVGKFMSTFAGDLVPAPKPVRKNTSVELSLRRTYNNNWQFLASYVWTKLEGNYDGSYQVATGQLDPGINSAFDYADFYVNGYGPLSSERKHMVKLDGSYSISTGKLNGLTIGASLHWFSGLPLNAYSYSPAYANWEYYIVPRGSLGHGPSEWEGDFHIAYPVKVSGRAKADLVLDVFNIFNRQAISQLYQDYNETSDPVCGGIPTDLCNGDGGWAHVPGTLTPVGSVSDPRATATSPDFLKAGWGYTAPRSARIGVRVSF